MADDTLDHAALGAALRQRTEAIVKAAIDARLEALGASVTTWAERAAQGAVYKAAAAAAAPAVDGLAELRAQAARTDETLARYEAVFRAADPERTRNDLAELAATQGRLEKSRGDILQQIASVHGHAQVIAAEVAESSARAEAARAAVEAEVQGLMTKMAETAASAATMAANDAASALAAAMTERVEAAITETAAKNLADAYRGPWADGTIYKRGDLALHRGTTWIRTSDPSEGGTPPPSAAPGNPWRIFVGGPPVDRPANPPGAG